MQSRQRSPDYRGNSYAASLMKALNVSARSLSLRKPGL
jgi:hypothetical protein